MRIQFPYADISDNCASIEESAIQSIEQRRSADGTPCTIVRSTRVTLEYEGFRVEEFEALIANAKAGFPNVFKESERVAVVGNVLEGDDKAVLDGLHTGGGDVLVYSAYGYILNLEDMTMVDVIEGIPLSARLYTVIGAARAQGYAWLRIDPDRGETGTDLDNL